MKGIVYVVLGLLSILSAAGCCGIPFRTLSLTGSGEVVTFEEDLTGFDEVEISHAFEADISRAEAFRVVIRIDDNLRQYLRVVKRGSTLEIGLEPGRLTSVGRATLEAEITMPELTRIEASGASDVTVTGFESGRPLDVELSGASQIRGDVEAGEARLAVSGASRVTISGSADRLTMEGSGASHIDLSDFSVVEAEIELSGATRATVSTSGRLDARASGASHVTYTGNPTLGEIETSGASSVKQE